MVSHNKAINIIRLSLIRTTKSRVSHVFGRRLFITLGTIMKNESLNEIFRNMPGNGSDEWEKTFYGHLSEFGEWNIEKFWVFHKALVTIGKQVEEGTEVNRNLAHTLLYIQQRVLTHVASHFNPAIDWQFESINDEQIYEYIERFELAILGAISGEVIPESSFDIVNPLLSNA